MKFNVKKQIAAFGAVAFTVLGILFGMQIMTFVFGNLGPANSGLPTGGVAFNVSQSIQNNSLEAIEVYSEQADTQFTTIAIVITIVLFLAVFALFWSAFMGGGSGRRSYGGGGGTQFE